MMEYDEQQVFIEITPTNIFKEAFSERDELMRLKKVSQAIEKITDVLPFDDKLDIVLHEKELMRFLFYSRVLIPDQIDMLIDSLFKRFGENPHFLSNCWACMEYFAELNTSRSNLENPKFNPAHFSHKLLSLKTLDSKCAYTFKRWALEIVLSIFETIVRDALFLNRTDPLIFFMTLLKSSEEQDILQETCLALSNIKLKYSFLWNNKDVDEKIEEIFMEKSSKFCKVPDLLRLDSDKSPRSSEEKPEVDSPFKMGRQLSTNSHQNMDSDEELESPDFIESKNVNYSFPKHLEKWLFGASRSDKLMVQRNPYIMESLRLYENVQILVQFVLSPRKLPISVRWLKNYPALEEEIDHPILHSPTFRVELKSLYDQNTRLFNSYMMRSYRALKVLQNIHNHRYLMSGSINVVSIFFSELYLIFQANQDSVNANMEHVGELLCYYITQTSEETLNALLEYNILFNLIPFLDVNSIFKFFQKVFCVNSLGSPGIIHLEVIEKLWQYAKTTSIFLEISEMMISCDKQALDLFKCDCLYKTPELVELQKSVQKVDVNKINFMFTKYIPFWPEDDPKFRIDIDKIRVYKTKQLADRFKKLIGNVKKENFSNLVLKKVLPLLKKNAQAKNEELKKQESQEEIVEPELLSPIQRSEDDNLVNGFSKKKTSRGSLPINMKQYGDSSTNSHKSNEFENTPNNRRLRSIQTTPSKGLRNKQTASMTRIQASPSHQLNNLDSIPIVSEPFEILKKMNKKNQNKQTLEKIVIGKIDQGETPNSLKLHKNTSIIPQIPDFPDNSGGNYHIANSYSNSKSFNVFGSSSSSRGPETKLKLNSSMILNTKLLNFESLDNLKQDVIIKINSLYPLSLNQIEQTPWERQNEKVSVSDLIKNNQYSSNIVLLFSEIFKNVVLQELQYSNNNFFKFVSVDFSILIQAVFQKQVIEDICENYLSKVQIIPKCMNSCSHKSLQFINFLLSHSHCSLLKEFSEFTLCNLESKFAHIQKIIMCAYIWSPTWQQEQIKIGTQEVQNALAFRIDILKNLKLVLELLPKQRKQKLLKSLYESTWSVLFNLIKEHPFCSILLNEILCILILGIKFLDSISLIKIWIKLNTLDYFQCQLDKHLNTSPNCNSRMDDLIRVIRTIVTTLTEEMRLRVDELFTFQTHLNALKSWQSLKKMIFRGKESECPTVTDITSLKSTKRQSMQFSQQQQQEKYDIVMKKLQPAREQQFPQQQRHVSAPKQQNPITKIGGSDNSSILSPSITLKQPLTSRQDRPTRQTFTRKGRVIEGAEIRESLPQINNSMNRLSFISQNHENNNRKEEENNMSNLNLSEHSNTHQGSNFNITKFSFTDKANILLKQNQQSQKVFQLKRNVGTGQSEESGSKLSSRIGSNPSRINTKISTSNEQKK